MAPWRTELAGYISTEVDRTNALVTRFLDFARPLALRLEKTEITEVIDEAVAQVEKHTRLWTSASIKLLARYPPPFLLDSPAHRARCSYNLLLNAAQASPPREDVTVKTRQAGDTVEIGVIDRGSGIAPKNRKASQSVPSPPVEAALDSASHRGQNCR